MHTRLLTCAHKDSQGFTRASMPYDGSLDLPDTKYHQSESLLGHICTAEGALRLHACCGCTRAQGAPARCAVVRAGQRQHENRTSHAYLKHSTPTHCEFTPKERCAHLLAVANACKRGVRRHVALVVRAGRCRHEEDQAPARAQHPCRHVQQVPRTLACHATHWAGSYDCRH